MNGHDKISNSLDPLCPKSYKDHVDKHVKPYIATLIRKCPPVYPHKKIPNVRKLKVKVLSDHQPVFKEA